VKNLVLRVVAPLAVFAVIFEGGMSFGQAPATGPEGTALTPEAIKTIISNMGYEPKELKTNDGQVYGYTFPYKGKEYNYSINVEISPSKKFVWASVWLKQLPDPKLPADRAAKALQISDFYGVAFLTHNEKNNYFRAKVYLLNSGIKPADMRLAIEDLDGLITASADVWDPEKWPGAKPKPATNK
jgi:hypothetical protein